jgi:hypothetical protein
MAMPGAASATTASTTYTASLQAVPLNTPSGAASGTFTLTLNGNQATISEHVTGLGDKLPTDKATLTALGIPSSFAGAPYPHVQHIHINGQHQCPTASVDNNHDGVLSTTEGQPAYGPIGTTLSTKGDTSPKAATNVLVAPGGGSFSYNRTITLDAATVSAIQNNKAVIVVHGLDPATAPKASLSTPNDLGVQFPGQKNKLALIATSPAICGPLVASQMSSTPVGSSPTGGGSTSGIEDEALLVLGGALALAGGGAFAVRRRLARES